MNFKENLPLKMGPRLSRKGNEVGNRLVTGNVNNILGLCLRVLEDVGGKDFKKQSPYTFNIFYLKKHNK